MADQTELGEFTAGVSTETVTRTVRLPLESSEQKNEHVREGIAEFREIVSYMADMIPSFPDYRWQPQDTTMYRVATREFPKDERTVKAKVLLEAQKKAAEAFQSWRERGKPGNRPRFDDESMLRLSSQDFELQANDRGYGLKTSFIPYNPIWFHVGGGEYQEEFLERIIEGEASAGSAELRFHGEDLYCHLTVTWDVEVYQPADIPRWVGVDLGESTLYAAAVVNTDGDVEAVEMESGREFRHHRERLKQKRAELSAKGDLRGVRECRNEHERYTDHITHNATREIVNLAVEHAPCGIRLEDLTHYRETAADPIHDWPFAKLQEQIAYKATEAGIPISFVDPRNTSVTCRRCGQTDPTYRDEADFHCRRCDYQVHADVNAAINLAQE